MTFDRAYIIGGDSQIGRAIGVALRTCGVPCRATTRRDRTLQEGEEFLDLAAETFTWRPHEQGGSDAVAFVCAGATSLEFCRTNPEASRRINVDQTMILVRTLAASGYRPILFSTNMVFDGTAVLPTPQTPTCPLAEYGRQKRDVERLVQDQIPGALILRLGKVLLPDMPLFVRWLEQWRRGEIVRAFEDLFLAPLPLSALLDVTLSLATKGVAGIWHLCPAEQCSYVDAARWLAARAGCDMALVEPDTAARAGIAPEHRPRYVALDSAATEAFCGLRLPTPQEALGTIRCDHR